MDSLVETLRRELAWYASGGLNSKAILLSNEEARVYAVNVYDFPKHELPAGIAVMARLEGEYIVIEEDRTTKPFEDRLMAAGVPRDKIILAYAGEKLPDSHQN